MFVDYMMAPQTAQLLGGLQCTGELHAHPPTGDMSNLPVFHVLAERYRELNGRRSCCLVWRQQRSLHCWYGRNFDCRSIWRRGGVLRRDYEACTDRTDSRHPHSRSCNGRSHNPYDLSTWHR